MLIIVRIVAAKRIVTANENKKDFILFNIIDQPFEYKNGSRFRTKRGSCFCYLYLRQGLSYSPFVLSSLKPAVITATTIRAKTVIVIQKEADIKLPPKRSHCITYIIPKFLEKRNE